MPPAGATERDAFKPNRGIPLYLFVLAGFVRRQVNPWLQNTHVRTVAIGADGDPA
jgi:hypothetical protein